jgi:hypothetical protein
MDISILVLLSWLLIRLINPQVIKNHPLVKNVFESGRGDVLLHKNKKNENQTTI